MAFQAMLSGAECSTGNNALSQLLKHTGGDKSLQHGDRTTAGPSQAGPSATGMRQHPMNGRGAPNSDAEAFFRQQQQQQQGFGGQPGGAFDFAQMKNEMGRMGSDGGNANGWAQEMAARGGGSSGPAGMVPPEVLHQMRSAGFGPAEMEAAFARGSPGPDGMHAQAWRQQFSNSPTPQSATPPGPDVAQQRASYTPRAPGMYGMGMMGMNSGGMGMYAQQRAPMSSTMSSSATKSADSQRFVELDNAQWEEQFAKLDELQDTTAEKGKGKAVSSDDQLPSEAEQNASIRKALDDIEKDVQADGSEAQSRFEELWNAMNSGNAADVDLAEWEKELTDERNRIQDEMYMHPGGGIGYGEAARRETAGIDGTEDALLESFGTINADGFPRVGKYRFEQKNRFIDHPDPLSEGLNLLGNRGSLTDAALLFEVATQRDAQGGSGGEENEVDAQRRYKSEAWRRLGEAQAMNEREMQAIRAFEEAIKIDEGNLEAYMGLAIAYTNEGYDTAAHTMLERYIKRAYPHIKPEPLPPAISGVENPVEDIKYDSEEQNPWAALNRVTSMFLQAARETDAAGRIDPEVQVGLGVLFYSNASYDQAKDCFETALKVRPNDFLLWNRLGATMANGGKPEDAIGAYWKALQLRPTFIRAEYNLAVSCLNMGAHHAAAEHLLSALDSLERTANLSVPPEMGGAEQKNPPGSGMSDGQANTQETAHLWSTLRRAFIALDRFDLAQKAHPGVNLQDFSREGYAF